jgi:hypothetical protein
MDSFSNRIVPDAPPVQACVTDVLVFNLGGTIPPGYWTKVQGDDEAHKGRGLPR